MDKKPILQVNQLEIQFKSHRSPVYAVRGIDFDLYQGETLAVVGESGCGKSVTVKSLLGLLPKKNAVIDSKKSSAMFEGKNLLALNEDELSEVRGDDIAMIFQDPMTSLNPTMKVGKQIAEPLIIHKGMSQTDAEKRALELLELVRIPEPKVRINQYPFEFSGGMRQRVVIAIALANTPKILIADEPTTALDVTIQAQILHLIADIQKELNMSVILVTHDLGIVASVADRIQVMYAGRILERGDADNIFYEAKHPYTRALLESVPTVKSERKSKLYSLEGKPPDLTLKGAACPFAPRCEFAMNICNKQEPPEFVFNEKHKASCWLHDARADKSGLPQSFLVGGAPVCKN